MTEEPPGYQIFRMDDIENCFLVDDELKRVEISDSLFKQFKLERNDILFNRVNSEDFVGRTGIFKSSGDCVFASYLVRVRVSPHADILPDYLNIFLNSEYGKKQIHRFARRAVNQANVNAEELKNFRICVISSDVQKEIRRLCDEAWQSTQLSESLYDQAESCILEGLDLRHFQPAYALTYTAELSEASRAQRLDAEHFQPACDDLIRHLENKHSSAIRQAQVFNKRGVQPEYVDNGPAKVVTSKRLGRRSLDYDGLETTNLESWKRYPDAQVRQFDLLLYTTGAYVGRTNCYLENDVALASNHVNILRVKDFNPIYVAVFMNSILGQMQVRRFVSGSAQVELYPTDISKFMIWKAPDEIQQKVAGLVQKSHESARKAKQLLDMARTKAEATIRKQG